jgi:hypothetical protein
MRSAPPHSNERHTRGHRAQNWPLEFEQASTPNRCLNIGTALTTVAYKGGNNGWTVTYRRFHSRIHSPRHSGHALRQRQHPSINKIQKCSLLKCWNTHGCRAWQIIEEFTKQECPAVTIDPRMLGFAGTVCLNWAGLNAGDQ